MKIGEADAEYERFERWRTVYAIVVHYVMEAGFTLPPRYLTREPREGRTITINVVDIRGYARTAHLCVNLCNDDVVYRAKFLADAFRIPCVVTYERDGQRYDAAWYTAP